MRRRTRLFILASAGVLALGVHTGRSPGAQRRRAPAPEATALAAAIAEIEAERKTTPLIGEPTAGGDRTVTFLARRAGGRVPRIVSDVTGWGEHADGTFDFTVGTMTRVGQTDWYSLQASVAPRARIEYLIAYGPTDYRFDLHNPRQAAGPQVGGAPASEFVMPGYVPPQEFADPAVSPAGQITETSVESRALRSSCRVIVYTPAGYRDDGDYPVAVFLSSTRSGRVSRVLDWLIAHQAIEPVVAVLVDPEVRGIDSRTSGGVGDPWGSRAFIADELLTWLASRYGVTKSAGRRAIIGISFGAKDALNAAISSGGSPDMPFDFAQGDLSASRRSATALGRRTDAFGRLGLLIPGRRIGRADLDAIAGRRNHRLRVAILAGQYDRANVATARSVRQALADAGHTVDYTEVPEGHSAVTWINHLRVVLVSLFGPASATTSPRGG